MKPFFRTVRELVFGLPAEQLIEVIEQVGVGNALCKYVGLSELPDEVPVDSPTRCMVEFRMWAERSVPRDRLDVDLRRNLWEKLSPLIEDGRPRIITVDRIVIPAAPASFPHYPIHPDDYEYHRLVAHVYLASPADTKIGEYVKLPEPPIATDVRREGDKGFERVFCGDPPRPTHIWKRVA